MGKAADVKKMLKMMENITNPEKMLLAALPINGRFLIDVFRDFPFQERTWKVAIFFKELKDEETTGNVTVEGTPTLFDLLNLIPLGEIELKAEVVTWKNLECIGLFLNPKTSTT